MGKQIIKVLAVNDPAVGAYVNKTYGVLEKFDGEVQFDVFPWNVYYSTMMDVFAGKAQYDIVMVAGHLWSYDFVNKGYLAEISYDSEDILPVIAAEMKCDGKQYLSPSFCDGHIIVYRKKELEKYWGRTFGKVVTPAEFIDAAMCINKATGKPSVALKADASEIFTDALPYLRMYGSDVYKDGISCCNNAEVIKGCESYCELKKAAMEGTDHFGNDEIAKAIREKQVPLAVTWSGQMGVVYTDECLEKEDLGFATFSTAWNVTWSFAVSSNSENKQQAEAFLSYLRSKEVDAVAGKVSGAPVRRSSYEAGKDTYPWYECQLEMFENAVPLPNMLMAGDKNGVLYGEIAEAFAGRKSAAEAMNAAKAAIDKIG